MNGRIRSRFCPLLVATAITVVCSACGIHQKTNANPIDRETAGRPRITNSEQADDHAELAGTAWQLVEIVSMDDRVYTPEDRSLYTLKFNAADGSMRIRADCNFGTGSWTSTAAGKLRFGRIAATQALCPSGSLHDRYMAQFEWVRSYIIKNGRLFLSTMADGSIIEFEPIRGK